MDIQQLKQSLKGDIYLDLRKYLLEKLLELKDIDNLKEIDNSEEQTIELKAQKRAYSKLKNILDYLGLLENVDIGKTKKDKAKDSFVV